MLDPSDKTYYHLPTPRKIELTWPFLRKSFAPIQLLEDSKVCENSPSIREVLSRLGQVIHDPQRRYEISAMIPFIYFHLNPVTILEVGEYASGMLSKTDIGEKTPASFFQSPFSQCYIHYPQEQIIDGVHGPQKVVGVYVNSIQREKFYGTPGVAEKLGIDPDKPLREFEIFWVGQTQDNATSMLAINTFKVTLNIQDEDQTIEELLDRHFDYYGAKEEIDTASFIREDGKNMSPEQAKLLRDLVINLTKVLLYLNTSGREMYENNALSELKKKKPKGESKIRKLQKRMSQTYDRIMIGPKGGFFEPLKTMNGGKGKTKEIHWRRGHFRRHQSDHNTLIRIAPTLVNKHLLEGDADVQTKKYETK